jgi:hypothetical protein
MQIRACCAQHHQEPAMSRNEIIALTDQLTTKQSAVSHQVMDLVHCEDFPKETADGFTVTDILQMWVHELRSHHRDLILARGRLINDNPHVHVPHFVRLANEEFGKFIGELSALTDEDLDRIIEPDGRTIREIVAHVLQTLDGYLVPQLESAIHRRQE